MSTALEYAESCWRRSVAARASVAHTRACSTASLSFILAMPSSTLLPSFDMNTTRHCHSGRCRLVGTCANGVVARAQALVPRRAVRVALEEQHEELHAERERVALARVGEVASIALVKPKSARRDRRAHHRQPDVPQAARAASSTSGARRAGAAALRGAHEVRSASQRSMSCTCLSWPSLLIMSAIARAHTHSATLSQRHVTAGTREVASALAGSSATAWLAHSCAWRARDARRAAAAVARLGRRARGRLGGRDDAQRRVREPRPQLGAQLERLLVGLARDGVSPGVAATRASGGGSAAKRAASSAPTPPTPPAPPRPPS